MEVGPMKTRALTFQSNHDSSIEMRNGEDGGGHKLLEKKMEALDLAVSSNTRVNSDDGFLEIIKAVQVAEASIKQQAEENNWLRSELEKKVQELRNYKYDGMNSQTPPALEYIDNHVYVPQREIALRNQINGTPTLGDIHAHQITNSMILKESVLRNDEYHVLTHFRSPAEKDSITGMMRGLHGGQAASNLPRTPELFSPVISSVAPIRYPANRESDPLLSLFRQSLPIAELNSGSLKQDLKLKIQEHEKEITQLRKHLAEYSAKEAEAHQEKHNLEKRIAHMHVALNQQRQDLVDAASRSISYRQDIAEENIHLAYKLQAAEQQRATFISSLMPLLAEYSLDSSVVDAQSVVGNVKVLFRHLRENLLHTEAKLKETRYQVLPRLSDMATLNATQSLSDNTETKDGLRRVQSSQYPDRNFPFSPDPLVTSDGDFLGHHQSVFGISDATTLEQDQTGRNSPLASRNTTTQPVNHEDLHPARSNEAIFNNQVSSRDLVSNNEFDESDMEIHQNHTEPPMYQKDAGPPASWAPKRPAYKTQEPSSSYSPNLPVVSEEQSFSFSEDDDLLPIIEGLQISGDAFPGRELQAYGLSKNGTTNCNFEWVRHLQDGSFNYIEGANQPQYLITADDVDSCLAIEVQPLDDRNRKGELVKVFANDQNKITCDVLMHNCISQTIDSGHASYRVSLSIGYLDMWEPSELYVKKNSYSIKCSGLRGVVVSEKYSPSTAVIIPSGSHMEFSIVDSEGDGHLLRADSTDISTCRDTIVLTLRYFIIQGNMKKKSKKRSMFFSK